ncbi:hypothetical protein ACG0Z5_22635, partial [Scandinavium sp. M-37]|uniref:hypothetical protein n=1 Tax=Scandinavium sp. M-37 TaxID=3373077 RepID=UPI0037459B86
VEWLVSVLANTKLTTFTAVFYWFTLNRDEPFFLPPWPENARIVAVYTVFGLFDGTHRRAEGANRVMV